MAAHLSNYHPPRRSFTATASKAVARPRFGLFSQGPSWRQRTVVCSSLALNIQNEVPDDYLQKAKDYVFYLNNPETKQDSDLEAKPQPLVRVRLNVHYRVHSRQMLCIGGSQIPFGWSFLSISKVPMTWNSGDVWTCEVSHVQHSSDAQTPSHP